LTDAEENFFYRLVVNCDDYGLMDGRETVVLARLYPLRIHLITTEVVRSHLDRLAEVGLIQLYEVASHPYLHIVTWDRHQQIRAKRPKYPKPDQAQSSDITSSPNRTYIKEQQSSDINGNQRITHVPVIQSNPIQSNPTPNPIPNARAIENDTAAAVAPNGAARAEPAEKKPKREDQAIWDAFAVELGTSPTTSAERGKWNAGIGDLRQAGITAQDVPALVAGYRDRFDNIACNPRAIANNLSDIRGPPRPHSNGRAVDAMPPAEKTTWDYYQEREERENREAAQRAVKN